MDCTDELVYKVYETKIINEGLADLKSGKVKDGKTVLDDMRRKYGF